MFRSLVPAESKGIRTIGKVVAAAALMLASVSHPSRGAFAFRDDPQCRRWTRAFQAMPMQIVEIRTAARMRILVPVRLAATEEARSAGFQCRSPDEIEKTVILFDFGQETQREFHMRNVPAPLDVAIVTPSGRIVVILRMDPSPTGTHRSPAPYRNAMEARAGFFGEPGIAPGDTMEIQGHR